MYTSSFIKDVDGRVLRMNSLSPWIAAPVSIGGDVRLVPSKLGLKAEHHIAASEAIYEGPQLPDARCDLRCLDHNSFPVEDSRLPRGSCLDNGGRKNVAGWLPVNDQI